MTCREKLKIEHPECIDEDCVGGCERCPSFYGYMPDPTQCSFGSVEATCVACWDREIPEEKSEAEGK